MSTVIKEIADQIIANNGYYADDERVQQVIKYTNAWGAEAYAILYRKDVDTNRYEASHYIRNPQIIWRAQ